MTGAPAMPTVLIVPGLRDHVDAHWQTLLAADLEARGRKVRTVPPMGRTDLDCATKVAAIERAAQAIEGPLIVVAHSGGCVMVAHWARQTRRAVQGALMATPPDFEQAMPEGYPTLEALRTGGWLPVPRERPPFPAIVAASRDDPLGNWDRVAGLAGDWGARLIDLGKVGHLNPASGFGPWPDAERFIDELAACGSTAG
ncbi:RBBP9/YdeN family alpha/beta hydrolase [Variovorax sp. GT1P44]|uniref:RBBP9/YdeN family alpha/beta hydrolase n=1 Tax=Variovorax sp. GT1P44 TaxID=3443742 RepID=UPI003F483B59